MIVVCNSSPLIALAKIERFDLLKSLFGRIYIPEAVWEEVVLKGQGKPGVEEMEEAINLWVERRDVQDKLAVEVLLTDLVLYFISSVTYYYAAGAKRVYCRESLASIADNQLL